MKKKVPTGADTHLVTPYGSCPCEDRYAVLELDLLRGKIIRRNVRTALVVKIPMLEEDLISHHFIN